MNGCLQLRDSWGLSPHSLTNSGAKVQKKEKNEKRKVKNLLPQPEI